jgi:hypothetical protein
MLKVTNARISKNWRSMGFWAMPFAFKLHIDPELWFVGAEFRFSQKGIFLYPCTMVMIVISWGLR